MWVGGLPVDELMDGKADMYMHAWMAGGCIDGWKCSGTHITCVGWWMAGARMDR